MSYGDKWVTALVCLQFILLNSGDHQCPLIRLLLKWKLYKLVLLNRILNELKVTFLEWITGNIFKEIPLMPSKKNLKMTSQIIKVSIMNHLVRISKSQNQKQLCYLKLNKSTEHLLIKNLIKNNYWKMNLRKI